MAESTVVRTKRDGIIVISDSGGAHTYTVDYEPGDFAYTVPDTAVNLFLDRGGIQSPPAIRKGDEEPMTGSFTVHMRDLGDTAGTETYTTIMDLCHRYSGGYADTNWTSTMGTSSDVLTVTIAYTIDGTAFGESDKTVTFSYCVLRGDFAEGDPNKFSVKFTSYAKIPTLS